MREEGCPPPTFDSDATQVTCILPAHPRHAILADLRAAEQALALSELTQARAQIEKVLQSDPLNARAIQLFAEVHHALGDPRPVAIWVKKQGARIEALPSTVLVQLAEALEGAQASADERDLATRLLGSASRGRLEERELRRIAVAMMRAKDDQGAIALIERHGAEHPEWEHNSSLLQLRGDAYIGLAKRCRLTAKRREVAQATCSRAWKEFHGYLERAERDLQKALSLSVDSALSEQIQVNLEFLEKLRRENQPPRQRRR